MSGSSRQKDVSQIVYFPEARGPETEACVVIRIYKQGTSEIFELTFAPRLGLRDE